MKFDNNSIESNNELDRFKSEIDLVAFIQKDGFVIDRSKSSYSSIALTSENSGSVIYVKQTSQGHQIFADRRPPLTVKNPGGTVIDYCINYHNKTLGQARVELRAALNLGLPTVNYDQISNRVRKETPLPSEEYFRFKRINNTQYLNSRGITNDTIYSPTFSGRVGEKLITSKRKDTSYYSTVFPMYERLSDKVNGLEVKNALYSGSYPGSVKETGFWKSNVPPLNPGQRPSAFFGESAIDAFSHYELHNKDNKQKIIYYATNGEIGGKSDRMQILNDYIVPRQHQFERLILGNDNDAAGIRFNINMIGNINIKESDSSIVITAQADANYAQVSFYSDDYKKVLKFAEDVHVVNNKLPVDSYHNLQYKYKTKMEDRIVKQPDGKFMFNFLMNNRKENLLPLEELAKKHKNSPFEIERAVNKDFSVDLEQKLGIERIKVEYGKDQETGKPLTRNQWMRKESPDKGIKGEQFGLER